MNVRNIGLKGLASVGNSIGTTFLRGLPQVSNPIILSEINTGLSLYFTQKNKVSCGKFEGEPHEDECENEDTESNDSDTANKVVNNIIGPTQTFSVEASRLTNKMIKNTIPYIDDFANGNIKFSDLQYNLRTNPLYNGKTTLKYIQDSAEKLSKNKTINKTSTYLGWTIILYAAVNGFFENEDEPLLNRFAHSAYQGANVAISGKVGTAVATAVAATGVGAPLAAGAGVVASVATGAVLSELEDTVVHPVKSYNSFKENAINVLDEVKDTIEHPVKSYNNFKEDKINILYEIEDEIRKAYKIPEGILPKGWSY